MLGELAPEGVFYLAIEEPIYSWGRKNPKAFAKSTCFMATIIHWALDVGCKNVYVVNPKTMKQVFTGNGKAEKSRIIQRTKEWYHSDSSKFGTTVPPLDWPTRKSAREAVADAVGIGFTAWRYRVTQSIPGVEVFS